MPSEAVGTGLFNESVSLLRRTQHPRLHQRAGTACTNLQGQHGAPFPEGGVKLPALLEASALLPATEFLSPLPPTETMAASLPAQQTGPALTLELGPLTGSSWGLFGKACLDRLAALAGLILLAPLLMLIAAAIRLDSAGPVIFFQSRRGFRGQEFVIYKFRTMRWNPSNRSGENQTHRKDCRVTRMGNFLRRTSLDELPQLWNVLNGTMSLVGPRPHPVAMRTEGMLGEEIAQDYPARHRVKPGITGLAQINGNRGATNTADQLRARLADDLDYIETWSLLLDLRIILLTPIRLVLHRGKAF